MQIPHLYLIVAAEVVALLVGVCVFLVVQNRSLRTLVKRLKQRLSQLVEDLRNAHTQKHAHDHTNASNYGEFLDQQITLTKKHHKSLASGPEIVLDLDPEAPPARRVAAIRHLLLLAEKEACPDIPGKSVDWQLLERKYEQLMEFHATYKQKSDDTAREQAMDALRQELATAKKHIHNLERFRALYFDLEEKWESSRDEAETQYNDLTDFATQSENANVVTGLLDAYQKNFMELGVLIENGIDGASLMGESQHSDGSATEIQHLRAVAADQHKIISDLQEKLRQASTKEQSEQIVNELNIQLQKQVRFVQESETCIQLLEDELATANKEIDQLKSRLASMPQLKLDLKALKEKSAEYESNLYNLQSENRRLHTKIQSPQPQNSASDEAVEVQRLKKEISALENKYAILEEKFLDLKI